ncbi:hypothetical protein [Calothrix rhizosoleniae]|uniref:hypothetical protein n=1 Tax=Calothrix rhizosoleniae TaxID=888997 RepID=UPI000B499050|nr:hypothetical protein [Calothrix rhizosoleniae]
MTITPNATSKAGQNAIKTLAKNHQHNLESDYTEKMKSLAQAFEYEKAKNHYWSDPRFSLFYGTPLYEQASLTQKQALNHLFWILFYKTTAESEIETVRYNLITAGTLLAMDSDYKLIAEQLEHEAQQERVHIHCFYKIGYKTQKLLLGKSNKSDLTSNTKKTSYFYNLSMKLNYFFEKILPKSERIKSLYLQDLVSNNMPVIPSVAI